LIDIDRKKKKEKKRKEKPGNQQQELTCTRGATALAFTDLADHDELIDDDDLCIQSRRPPSSELFWGAARVFFCLRNAGHRAKIIG